MAMSEIVPIAKAARILGIKEKTLTDYAREGKMRYVRDKSQPRQPISGIYADSLEAYTARRQQHMAAKGWMTVDCADATTRKYSKGPRFCEECGQLVDEPGLCQDCQDEADGLPYWASREAVCAFHRGARLAGMD
jgi:hypothetical protein